MRTVKSLNNGPAMVYKSLHDAQKLHDETAFNMRRSVAPNSSENSKVQIEENKMCWKSK